MAKYYRTQSGVLVREFGRRTERDGKIKIFAYRVDTGGWHGLIWLNKCTIAKPPKSRSLKR
jgi:hypothetical protein